MTRRIMCPAAWRAMPCRRRRSTNQSTNQPINQSTGKGDIIMARKFDKNSAEGKAWRERRDARIRELTDEFNARTLALRDTREWRRLLAYFTTFHNYSYRNTMLIALQHPGATWVAGFAAWRKRGRQVRKGEKGILITVPSGRYEATDDSGAVILDSMGEPVMRQGFMTKTVFDISQTDPIPGQDVLETRMSRVARPLTGDEGRVIVARVAAWLTSVGWHVSYADMTAHGDIDMAARSIILNKGDSPDMHAVTILHDAAHVAFITLGDEHHKGGMSGVAETENASVAFVLAGMMGLDTSAFTIGYAAGWALLDRSSLKGIAEHVQKCVKLMADAILAANMPDDDPEIAAPRPELNRAA